MTLERFRLAAVLPSEGGWRLELVLDASVAPPKPVVLARIPAAIAGDALALTALMRDVERAVRVVHPSLLPVRGLADAGGLAVLCDWREGVPLHALLEAGGPLAPPLAARVLRCVAEALQAVHATGAVHGDVRPERILVAENGAVLLGGLGRSAGPGATPEEDLAGLARLATACLGPAPGAGEAAAAVVAASVQATPAEVIERLRGDQVATSAEMAARLESAMPSDGAVRSARRLALTMARKPVAAGEATAERPALSPPPLPSGLRTVAGAPPQAGAPPGPRSEAPPAPPTTARRRPESAAPARPPPSAPAVLDQGLGRLGDPRLPLLVGVAMAIVGLVAGYWLGS